MPVPDWLAQFGRRCAALPGAGLTTAENGLTVAWRGREVQVDADRADPGRAVLWLDLKPAARPGNAELAAAAAAHTAAALVPTGFAMGFNPKVRLLLLGRSVEREALAPGRERALLDGVVTQADAANAALAAPEPVPDTPRATKPDPRFKAYVGEALATAGIEAPELDGNRLLLKVAERWVEVLFEPADGRLAFVGIIAEGRPVKADLVGQFNAFNLFHGGYSLLSPPGTGCVYLAQCHAMALLPAADMLPRLAGFEERAGAAGQWYETWKEPAAA